MNSMTNFWMKATQGLQYDRSKNLVDIYTRYGQLQVNTRDFAFPVTKYTILHYEDNANIKQYYAYDDGTQKVLTANEVVSISSWLRDFYANGNYPDISLPCYNPKDANLYQGTLPLSEIQKKGYTYVEVPCDYQIARWDDQSKTWLKIKAIIREDGTFAIDPDKYCDICILFLTEEEWSKMPPYPEGVTKDQEYYIRWDFATSNWKDIRTVEFMEKYYRDQVTARFEYLKRETLNYYFGTSDIITLSNQLLTTATAKSSTDTAIYDEGVNEVTRYLSISAKNLLSGSAKAANFTNEELFAMCKDAIELLDGQMYAWLNVPSVQNLVEIKYDGLHTVPGWQKLLTAFNEWYTDLYIN